MGSKVSTTSTDIGTDWNEVEDVILGRAAGRTDSDDSFLDYKREETELPCRSFTHSGWSEVQDIAGTEGKVQIEFEFPSDKSEFKNYRQKSVFLCCLDSNGRGVFVEPGNTSIDDITEALLNASRSIKAVKALGGFGDNNGRGLLQIHYDLPPQKTKETGLYEVQAILDQGERLEKGIAQLTENQAILDKETKAHKKKWQEDDFFANQYDYEFFTGQSMFKRKKGNIQASDCDGKKIQYQYKKLAHALGSKQQSLVDDLSSESINKLKKSWSQLLEILLPSFSSSFIDLSRKSSYFNMGFYDNEDIVCTSLKILEKFAKMQVLDIKEVQQVFFNIGIESMLENDVITDESSEAIFCLTIDATTETELDSEDEKLTLCQTIEKGIYDAMKTPTKLEWVKNRLKKDGTFPENVNIDFQNIDISVLDIFPGSHKIIVRFKNLIYPEDPLEAHYTMKLFEAILENLPSVETSCLYKHQYRPEDGTLQIKIHVDKKYIPTWNMKKKLKASIECLIEEVRHAIDKDGLEDKLLTMGVAPTSIEILIEHIFEPDMIEIDIEPPQSCHVETMRLKNIPLWPRDKTRLLELTPQNQFDISNGFTIAFSKRISWEDIATELDVLKNNDIYLNLQGKISRLGKMSPYPTVINEYKEQQGTVGGLLTCLDKIRKSEEVIPDLRSKIDDLISSIHVIKESHFREWSKTYDNKQKAGILVDSYNGLKKALSSCSSHGWVLSQDFCEWSETARSVVEEGDQIWMWREGNLVKPSYAHVAIYIGDNYVVHVQQEGLSGIVIRDQVEAVIAGSKFFIFRPSQDTLEGICGTPKERALACLGLKFTYSVTSGNCEVFANIVCNGKWDVWDSVQGEEHAHLNRLVTVVNGVSHFKTYQKQQRSLISKIAKRMLLQGLLDSSLIQYNAAFETHDNIQTDTTNQMFKETKMKRYRLMMVWKILEEGTSEKNLFRSDWSNEGYGRTCEQINGEMFESSALEMFNKLPKGIRNITDCSLEDFVKSLDPHLVSEQDNMEIDLGDIDLSVMTVESSTTDTTTVLTPITVTMLSENSSRGASSDNSTCEMIDKDSDSEFTFA